MASILNENAITLLGQVLGDEFNVTSDTTLFTVPPGKEFTPFIACISNSSGNMTTAEVSFGQSGAKTDFLGTQTLTGLSAAGKAIWLGPTMDGATPVGIVTYTAGEIFVMDHVTAQGTGMTADVSIFGFINVA